MMPMSTPVGWRGRAPRTTHAPASSASNGPRHSTKRVRHCQSVLNQTTRAIPSGHDSRLTGQFMYYSSSGVADFAPKVRRLMCGNYRQGPPLGAKQIRTTARQISPCRPPSTTGVANLIARPRPATAARPFCRIVRVRQSNGPFATHRLLCPSRLANRFGPLPAVDSCPHCRPLWAPIVITTGCRSR